MQLYGVGNAHLQVTNFDHLTSLEFGGNPTDVKNIRIIIVDENRDVTSILAGTFGLKGYEVYKAYSV